MTEIIVLLPCGASSEMSYLEHLRDVMPHDVPRIIVPSKLARLEAEIGRLKAEIEQLKTAQKLPSEARGSFRIYNLKSGVVNTATDTMEQAVKEARRLYHLTKDHHGVCHFAECGSTETWSEEV